MRTNEPQPPVKPLWARIVDAILITSTVITFGILVTFIIIGNQGLV
jgi:hypothetical protein